MDATVRLAIIEKLRSLFAEPNIYLACPLTPTVYRAAQLEAAGNGSSNAEELAQESAWIRSVNFVPGAGFLIPNEVTYLWDVLTDLKRRSVSVAESSAATANDAVKAAGHLLYEDPEAIPPAPTEAYRRYLECQLTYLDIAQLFRQRQEESGTSTDPNVAAFWNDTMKPALQSKIDDAMLRWQGEGRKSDIESAKRLLLDASINQSEEQWLRWSNQFRADVDSTSDLNLVQFVPTSFSPPGLSSQAGWSNVVVDSGDYEDLANGSPADVKQMLYATDPGFVSFSFEYARVAVERAWFPKGMFESRIWKPAEDDLKYSDGGSPPTGRLPGHVVGVLLVRNIEVRKLAPKPDPPTDPMPPKFPFKHLHFLKTKMGGSFFAKKMQIVDIPAAFVPAADPMPADTFAAMTFRPEVGFHRVSEFKAIDAAEVQIAVAGRKPMWRIDRDLNVIDDFRALDEQMQELMRQKVIPTVIAAAMPTVSEWPLAADDICAIGFLWKGFPASPNPDPALKWPEP